jgi:hypothetical protein
MLEPLRQRVGTELARKREPDAASFVCITQVGESIGIGGCSPAVIEFSIQAIFDRHDTLAID